MTADQALRQGAGRLSHLEGGARDARLLLAAALGCDPARLLLVDGPLDAGALARFEAHLAARADRVPVSHLTGRRAFWDHTFEVTPDVLDPRPETEILVAEALRRPFASVLDLGTGSGCILGSLLAARPRAEGLGTDISEAALTVAGRNLVALGVAGRARLAPSDWFGAVQGRFDLIVSNPPYIPAADMSGLAPELAHEPRGALTDGGDGLSAYRTLFGGAARHLAPGGRVLAEFGAGQ
ncbi:MAG: peptide chain release factor N(5)-glutamine methyltransferase, partial [Shimia sp.]